MPRVQNVNGEPVADGTYIVKRQVGVVGLDAVVQDGHDDALAGVALLPGGRDVHVVAVLGATVLSTYTCHKLHRQHGTLSARTEQTL